MGKVINTLEKIKKWHPLRKKEEDLFSNQSTEKYNGNLNIKDEFNSMQQSMMSGEKDRRMEKEEKMNNLNSFEPMPPPYKEDRRPSLNYGAEDNQVEKEQYMHNRPEFNERRSIPFEEPAPLSMERSGNSPEMEKLDTLMIEIRNIKAQNTQILSEIRLLQDRLRRTY